MHERLKGDAVILTFAIVLLLVAAVALIWMTRGSLAMWSAAMALAPVPALAVMLIFAERFPDEPPGTEALRLFLGVIVCYGAVWLAILAGWLARRMATTAG